MYQKEIFQLENGYGYRILLQDNILIEQDIKPYTNGVFYMTEAEANKFADEEIEKLLNPIMAKKDEIDELKQIVKDEIDELKQIVADLAEIILFGGDK